MVQLILHVEIELPVDSIYANCSESAKKLRVQLMEQTFPQNRVRGFLAREYRHLVESRYQGKVD